MELFDLLAILGKYRRLIILVTLAFGLGTFLVSLQFPPRYEAVLTLYVKRDAEPPSAEFYTYDGYYSQQAAERYTDTVVGLLERRGLLKEVLSSLGLPADQKSVRRVRRSVKVERVAPQLVEIRVKRKLGEEARDITNSLAADVISQVRGLNKAGDEALSVELLDNEPVVEKHEPLVVLNTVVGVLVGFLVSILASLFWEYLKN